MGADVWITGPLPTPGIAFITSSMRADAGVVISASHNPYADNGIKLFARDGFKLEDSVEAEIEALMQSDELSSKRARAEDIGYATRIEDARGRYVVFCKSTFATELTLDGLRIVVDCAHGAAYRTAPLVFEELGADVIPHPRQARRQEHQPGLRRHEHRGDGSPSRRGGRRPGCCPRRRCRPPGSLRREGADCRR